jgi:hypothetical protein
MTWWAWVGPVVFLSTAVAFWMGVWSLAGWMERRARRRRRVAQARRDVEREQEFAEIDRQFREAGRQFAMAREAIDGFARAVGALPDTWTVLYGNETEERPRPPRRRRKKAAAPPALPAERQVMVRKAGE